MIAVPTAAKITVYCFFSLGTAVKLEKKERKRKKKLLLMYYALVST